MGVAFNAAGNKLAAANWDTTINLRADATHSDQSQLLPDHLQTVTAVAFSPDGATLASGSWDTHVILWDVDRHARLGEPPVGHTGIVTSIAFSPDGRNLVSGGQDGDLILWQVDVNGWKQSACSIANRNLQDQEWEPYIRLPIWGSKAPRKAVRRGCKSGTRKAIGRTQPAEAMI